MPASIAIRILGATNTAATVSVIRESSRQPLAKMAAAIKSNTPVRICDLFGRDHVGAEAALRHVFARFDEMNVSFELHIDGRVETREYLLNRIDAYHQSNFESRLEAELEIGEPSPDAERWGRGEFVQRDS